LITEESRNHNNKYQEDDIDIALCCRYETCAKENRVTGEKEAKEQTRLYEDNRPNNEIKDKGSKRSKLCIERCQ